MRTYDIINAGPRNRFMANGRIVSNSGKLVQPQNLTRLNTKAVAEWHGVSAKQVKEAEVDAYLTAGIEATLADAEEFFFDDPIAMLSNCVRGSFIAAKGMKLVCGDLSQIEGRYAAWIAEENWKLDAYRQYDTYKLDADGNKIPDGKGDWKREGADLYCVAYGKSFGIDPHTVDKDQRQIGKTQELFLQYRGGTSAFATGARNLRIDLEAMAENAISHIPLETLKKAEEFMHWMQEKEEERIKKEREDGEVKTIKGSYMFGLSERAYIVCDSFKRLWREAHPAISSYWDEIDSSIRECYANPMLVVTMRKMKVQFIKGWLRMLCPDGSYLCYPQFQVADDGTFSFMEQDSLTRKWRRQHIHSGQLFNHIVQGGSRNVFCNSYAPVEAAGYRIVLRVHDEIASEVPDTDEYTVDGLCKILATVPEWGTGLPLAAAGFQAYRYKK